MWNNAALFLAVLALYDGTLAACFVDVYRWDAEADQPVIAYPEDFIEALSFLVRPSGHRLFAAFEPTECA